MVWFLESTYLFIVGLGWVSSNRPKSRPVNWVVGWRME